MQKLTGIVRACAYAKLNISLDVCGKREDGYHDMLMVMQTVSLCDTLELRPTGDGGIRATCNLPYVPGDERNLAVRAAKEYLAAVGAEGQGLRIHVNKKIPVGAGMAGGSTDAAAVLRALNAAFHAALTREELLELAARIGSDVAFCLEGGTMLASGRGELLSPLPSLPDCTFVIGKPEFSVSTPELFRKLDQVRLRRHPDTAGILAALESGSLPDIARRMYNVFEDVDDRRLRTVSRLKSRLLDCGALGAVMTGTGSAVFGIFDQPAAAEEAAAKLKKEFRFCTVASPVGTLL